MALGAIFVLGLIVTGIVVLVGRALGRRSDTGADDGNDLIAYLLLGIAVITAGFAMASLASTAFPGERFVFDPADELATALASLAVSLPIALYLWRRQAPRRGQFPASAGWALYLTLVEAVFVTAFVINAAQAIDSILSGDWPSTWPQTVVFGAIVVFHELAARATPPRAETGELRRVVGAAIGLITLVIGLVGVLGAGLFDVLYDSLRGVDPEGEFAPWLALTIVGAPIWWYRWLRPWDDDPTVPRLTWAVLVSAAALVGAVGAATTFGVFVLQYLFSDTRPAGEHFESMPVIIAFGIVGLAVWLIHRRALGRERSTAVRAYEYLVAAVGLGTAIATASGLTILAFGDDVIVGGDRGDVVSLAFVVLVAIAVWWYFSNRHREGPPSEETTAWPRRVYHLGAGIVTGLVAAGSLISALLVILQRVLGGTEGSSLLIPGAIFLYTGLATWYLLGTYFRDRESVETVEIVAPFEVTIVCSHPGLIAAKFPTQARLRVMYRGDEVGVIDEEMADAIVGDVGNADSLVWVDEGGYRVAPARKK